MKFDDKFQELEARYEAGLQSHPDDPIRLGQIIHDTALLIAKTHDYAGFHCRENEFDPKVAGEIGVMPAHSLSRDTSHWFYVSEHFPTLIYECLHDEQRDSLFAKLEKKGIGEPDQFSPHPYEDEEKMQIYSDCSIEAFKRAGLRWIFTADRPLERYGDFTYLVVADMDNLKGIMHDEEECNAMIFVYNRLSPPHVVSLDPLIQAEDGTPMGLKERFEAVLPEVNLAGIEVDL